MTVVIRRLCRSCHTAFAEPGDRYCRPCELNRVSWPGGLPADNRVLVCERGHDHKVGVDQVERILRDSCPWCGTALRLVQR